MSIEEIHYSFDLVICTYNRPDQINAFVKEILEFKNRPPKILIVDSSDSTNDYLEKSKEISYQRSPLRNQPFQRFLGANKSKAKNVLFFDDDLSIVDEGIFDKLEELTENPDFAGGAIGIDYQTKIPDYFTGPDKISNFWKNLYYKLISLKIPEMGKIGFLGVTGGLPKQKSQIQFIPGPCMLLDRLKFLKCLDFGLLFGFNEKILMGEDKVISLKIQQYGKLYFDPAICLKHPPNESTYFSSPKSFHSKTVFSRFFISKYLFQLRNFPLWILRLRFLFFYVNFTLIAFLKMMIRPAGVNSIKFQGAIGAGRLLFRYGGLSEKSASVKQFKEDNIQHLDL